VVSLNNRTYFILSLSIHTFPPFGQIGEAYRTDPPPTNLPCETLPSGVRVCFDPTSWFFTVFSSNVSLLSRFLSLSKTVEKILSARPFLSQYPPAYMVLVLTQ